MRIIWSNAQNWCFIKAKKISKLNLKCIADCCSFDPFARNLLQAVASSSPIVFYPKAQDVPLIDPCFKADIDNEVLSTTEKPNVILTTVAKLELSNSIPNIVNLVHYLKQSTKVKQVFIWCSTKNIRDNKLIPFLQYMANIEVTLKNESELQILTKRNTGSVTRKVNINMLKSRKYEHFNKIWIIIDSYRRTNTRLDQIMRCQFVKSSKQQLKSKTHQL